MNGKGVCTNAKCARAERLEPIEIYPGPGEYCPDCGELLRPAATPEPATDAAPHRTVRKLPFAAAAIAAAVVLIVAGVVALPQTPALGVRVCDSSMTERGAREIVRMYSDRHRVWPYHYTVTRPGDLACDVRFSIAGVGTGDSIIARDGVVAIVNPQNRIVRLDIDQLRRVFAGEIVDWSQLGGPRGAIVAVLPEDGSDEAATVTAKVMLGHPFGLHDIRLPASEQIARLISSPSGARSIGIVPFSMAAPAKVIALGHGPPPNPLSIANDRYPLSVRVTAESDFRAPRAPASALLAFARSADANELLMRTALVSKSNP